MLFVKKHFLALRSKKLKSFGGILKHLSTTTWRRQEQKPKPGPRLSQLSHPIPLVCLAAPQGHGCTFGGALGPVGLSAAGVSCKS